MRLYFALLCMAAIPFLEAQEFSANVKPHSILLRNGSFSILVHRKYPLLTFDGGLRLSFAATKNGTNKTLEMIENSAEIKSVRWISIPEENREGEQVQSEFTVEIRKNFPGVLIAGKVFNRDFIGALRCRQIWCLPITEAAMPAEKGELRLGTPWKKLPPQEYFLYRSRNGQLYGFLVPGLGASDRTVYSNIGIHDFEKGKKGGLFFGVSNGAFEEDEFSEYRFIVVPVKDLPELKKIRETLGTEKQFLSLENP